MQARVRFVLPPRNHLRRSCVSSARNACESAICPVCARNPLRRSCVSRARNAGESAICPMRAQPSREIVRVECAKCRRECDLSGSGATFCGDRACRVREMQARVRFVLPPRNHLRRSCVSSARNACESAICPVCARNPLRRSCVSSARKAGESAFWRLAASFLEESRTKCAFWRLGASLLEEISYETLVLETCRFTFGGCLARNARFGDLALHFWRKSRTKRSFWRFAASLLEEVLHETRVLETWRFTFGGSLVGNARFGDGALHFWRKSCTKRSIWRLDTTRVELDSDLASL